MKNQAFFTLKDKIKKIEVSSAAIFACALGVNRINKWSGWGLSKHSNKLSRLREALTLDTFSLTHAFNNLMVHVYTPFLLPA